MQVHLQVIGGELRKEQLDACREKALLRTVTRDGYNIWFESDATNEELQALCDAYGLTIIK